MSARSLLLDDAIASKALRALAVNITGMPRPEETGTLIGVRLQRDMLDRVDAFIRSEPTPISRPEAIRRLVAKVLKGD